jgi:hypothetical protein
MHDAVVQVHTDPVQIAVQAGSIFDSEANGLILGVLLLLFVGVWCDSQTEDDKESAITVTALAQASQVVAEQIPAAGLAGPTRADTRTLEPAGADRTGFSGTTGFSP